MAIKRAQHGSLQGDQEFKTEIELLSRIHHKNVVSLVGFCYEQGEQILIYEFISNGTLKRNLSGTIFLLNSVTLSNSQYYLLPCKKQICSILYIIVMLNPPCPLLEERI